MTANPEVDAYIRRSGNWPEEIAEIRPVLLSCGLDEHIKWGKPCYSHEGRSIAIIQEMKHFLSLMFFKGALLSDPAGILRDQGPNSRSARRVEFTSVGPAPDLVLVDELRSRLDGDPALAAAFARLTPGRQREYNLYVAGAKQASTREARVDKHARRILDGKGLRDR